MILVNLLGYGIGILCILICGILAMCVVGAIVGEIRSRIAYRKRQAFRVVR